MKRQFFLQLALGLFGLAGIAWAQTGAEPLPAAAEAAVPVEASQQACRCSVRGHAPHCHRHLSNLKARLQVNQHWGYPEQFIEAPFGASLRCLMAAQIANGVAADMVLYHYDFYGVDTDRAVALTPRGHMELAKIVRAIPYMPSPVLIETTDDPALDASRRAYVLEQLAELGVTLDPDQVRSAVPPAPGLSGVEAEVIYEGQLGDIQPQAGGGSGGAGPLQFLAPGAGAQPPAPAAMP